MADYPEYCLRGIYGQDDLTTEGRVSAIAYFPKSETAQTRDDGKCETSIDWEDDEEALPACMSRYPRGVARLPRSHIDEINHWPGIDGTLNYERKPIPGNDRHGNILFPANFMAFSKTQRIMIAGAIALRAMLVVGNK